MKQATPGLVTLSSAIAGAIAQQTRLPRFRSVPVSAGCGTVCFRPPRVQASSPPQQAAYSWWCPAGGLFRHRDRPAAAPPRIASAAPSPTSAGARGNPQWRDGSELRRCMTTTSPASPIYSTCLPWHRGCPTPRCGPLGPVLFSASEFGVRIGNGRDEYAEAPS